MLRVFTAEDGKVWKEKATGMIMSNTLYLSASGDINDFEQVDIPVEAEEVIEINE